MLSYGYRSFKAIKKVIAGYLDIGVPLSSKLEFTHAMMVDQGILSLEIFHTSPWSKEYPHCVKV